MGPEEPAPLVSTAQPRRVQMVIFLAAVQYPADVAVIFRSTLIHHGCCGFWWGFLWASEYQIHEGWCILWHWCLGFHYLNFRLVHPLALVPRLPLPQFEAVESLATGIPSVSHGARLGQSEPSRGQMDVILCRSSPAFRSPLLLL